MGQLFGTDGVRGVANKELTGELAYKLGRAGGYYITKDYRGNNKPVMLIGKDTRISGDMLESALIAGMTSVGINVISLGIIPTPGVSYLTATMPAQGGVMISASHNPIADNGIKFFNEQGYKLADEIEEEIEDLVFNKYEEIPYPTHTGIGNVEGNYELVEKYIEHLINTIEEDFMGLKIVLDCANGAAYKVAPEVLSRLGAELIFINNHPDGSLINVNCGSTHPEVLRERVLREGADLGIAHDGDADRVIMVDEKGNIVGGDNIMAVCALDMLKKNTLKGKTLVATGYSNLGLKEVIEEAGGKIAITANGDRYVLREMLNNGYNLGGEQSGHIIFLDYNKTGDGVLTAIQLIQIIKRNNKTLNELTSQMKPWPQRLANVRVKRKEEWQDNDIIKAVIEKTKHKLGEEGRIFVRASGTEPVVRVMLEGKNGPLLEELEDELVNVINRELN